MMVSVPFVEQTKGRAADMQGVSYPVSNPLFVGQPSRCACYRLIIERLKHSIKLNAASCCDHADQQHQRWLDCPSLVCLLLHDKG
jgi:hypothetical protein